MRSRDLWAGGAFALLVAACEIVEPREVAFQASIVVEAAPEYADVFRDVDGIELRIWRTDGSVRDTVLEPRVSPQQVRARAVLRPDEGERGTAIGVLLTYDHPMTNDVPLFVGVGVLDEESGWPSEARLRVEPVADLEVGPDRLIASGDRIQLDDLTPIVFLDGRARPSRDIMWSSTDTSIVRVVGLAAEGRAMGQAEIVALWHELSDTFSVDVAASGTIVVTPTNVLHYVGTGDRLADSMVVENFQVGDVGTLTTTVATAFPWLSATLMPNRPPALLIVEMDGALLPPGGAVGEVVLSSSEPGVSDAVVTVDARGEPASGVETRSWNPLCIFGDSISPPNPGIVACVDLQARAWSEGPMKRVVLEVQNLLGSRGDSLDTANLFVLRGFGINSPEIGGSSELLGVRPNGSVGAIGSPTLYPVFELHVWGQPPSVPPRSPTAILGCLTTGWTADAFRTCDPQGQTGSVRVDFQVADTSWTLATASATIHIDFPGYIGSCTAPGAKMCFVP